jgi:hypothetical protein
MLLALMESFRCAPAYWLHSVSRTRYLGTMVKGAANCEPDRVWEACYSWGKVESLTEVRLSHWLLASAARVTRVGVSTPPSYWPWVLP